MKAFTCCIEDKEKAIARARAARLDGSFYAWGHYWDRDGAGKWKGNVSGVMYHPYLKEGENEQAVIKYPAAVHGIPEDVARMIDTIFSGLSLNDDKELHFRCAETVYAAIQPGADLSRVPAAMAAHILEQKEWLADYADENTGHWVGMMHGYMLMQSRGDNVEKYLNNFYNDHIHKLHRHQLNGEVARANYVRAALRALSQNNYCFFLKHAADGRAANRGSYKTGPEWKELAWLFEQALKAA